MLIKADTTIKKLDLQAVNEVYSNTSISQLLIDNKFLNNSSNYVEEAIQMAVKEISLEWLELGIFKIEKHTDELRGRLNIKVSLKPHLSILKNNI